MNYSALQATILDLLGSLPLQPESDRARVQIVESSGRIVHSFSDSSRLVDIQAICACVFSRRTLSYSHLLVVLML